MNTSENRQKIKLLKLYEMLKNETDEFHAISRIDLCDRLNKIGISSNVRTLSKDIDVLNKNGYTIDSYFKNREKYYYVPSREFEDAEIRVMIDAVEAASFINYDKTKELVDKLYKLGGIHFSEIQKDHVVYINSKKHSSDIAFNVIEKLSRAIEKGKKVKFNYTDLDEYRNKVCRITPAGDIKDYIVDPIFLVFNDDNYYLVACCDSHPGTTAHYRVDRIINAEVLDENISEEALDIKDNASADVDQAVKMFKGEPVYTELQFDGSLIGAVYDEFGEKVKISFNYEDLKTYNAKVNVQISPTFFAWVFQFGKLMRITGPNDVVLKYKEHIKNASL